jgi:peptide/nickel transport system permease protein
MTQAERTDDVQNLAPQPSPAPPVRPDGAGRRKQGYWRIVGRQFRRNTPAMVAAAILLFLMLVAVFAPFLAGDRPIYMVKDGQTYWFPNIIDYDALLTFDYASWEPGPGEAALRPLVPYSSEHNDLLNRLKEPSKRHWLGTDDRGRDVLSRLIWGTRVSMSVGFVAVGISLVIGMVLGALAGYYRGWVDVLVLRLIEIMLCFPTFILILSLVAFLPPSIWNIMIAIGLTGWTGVARLVRGEFLKLRESDFVTAARATGLRDSRVMFRHILPNALSPVFVTATFGVAGAILTESALSFLGFGVPPPDPSWGEVLSQSKRYVDFAWWLVTFPGAAIFITVTAFNLVGDGLRDAMDPRLRQ